MISNNPKIIDRDAWHDLHSKVQQRKIVEAFQILRRENIEPILIKGWAIARLYPPHRKRFFADIDLCVAPEDFQKARNFLQTERALRLNIDLHNGLRHLDTMAWVDLFKNTRLVKIDLDKIRVLRPEDHLRILAVHWLTDGGENKERLWDIYYCFAAEPDKFDWDVCLQTVSEKRRRWIICTIGLAQKYLSVSLEKTPFESKKIEIPDWVTETVEKEWQSDVKLKPLQTCLKNGSELFRQIKKRFPPNPLQAVVAMEGNIDCKSPFKYQFANFFLRAFPAIRRIGGVMFRKNK